MSQNNTSLSGEEDDRRSHLRNLRILLVEDDRLLNEMLTDFLVLSCGSEVISVTSATEALEAVQAQRLDILLVNILLPDEDGYSFIRKVRSLAPEAGGQIPALAITPSASETSQRLILEAGFQGYFSKPFQTKKLIELIANLV